MNCAVADSLKLVIWCDTIPILDDLLPAHNPPVTRNMILSYAAQKNDHYLASCLLPFFILHFSIFHFRYFLRCDSRITNCIVLIFFLNPEDPFSIHKSEIHVTIFMTCYRNIKFNFKSNIYYAIMSIDMLTNH